MSRRTNAVVCKHVVRLGNDDIYDPADPYGENLAHGWIMVASAADVVAGKQSIMVDQYVKEEESKVYCVNFVNESDYDGGFLPCIFAGSAKDVEDFVKDNGDYGDDLPDLSGYTFAGERASVEKFCDDFGLDYGMIEDTSAVKQTL